MLTSRYLSDRNASDSCPIEKMTPNVMVLFLCRKLAFVSNLQTYFIMSLLTDKSLFLKYSLNQLYHIAGFLINELDNLWHIQISIYYMTVMFLTFWKLLYCDTGVSWQNLCFAYDPLLLWHKTNKQTNKNLLPIRWSLSFPWFIFSSWFRIY